MPQAYTFTSYKYPRTPHRRWLAYGPFPGEGCQLFVRRDVEMLYVGTRRRWFNHEPCWEIVWPDRGYKMALWFRDDGGFGGLYGDICLPPDIDSEAQTVDFLDLDLDVVGHEEGGALRVRVIDRQEFIRNRRALHYPGTLAAFAEGALGRLLSDIGGRRYPLDRPLAQWRDELLARLEETPTGVFGRRA
ncbi:MAG: DUF402 domain-containing protein [Thermaerobacter sp.]|nr:DUF402 domain-containing protein [Thermaerobacter sp.]